MKISRYGTKILTITMVVVFLGILMINFDSIFTDLNCDALTVSQTVNEDKKEVPNSINFIDEDKNAFVNYCKDIYGESLPLEVNGKVFYYFGTVNGYRFYRIHCSYIPSENINVKEIVGGYTFESPNRCRPDKAGLYIIGNDTVLTLPDAYKQGLIDIAKIYKLYSDENSK